MSYAVFCLKKKIIESLPSVRLVRSRGWLSTPWERRTNVWGRITSRAPWVMRLRGGETRQTRVLRPPRALIAILAAEARRCAAGMIERVSRIVSARRMMERPQEDVEGLAAPLATPEAAEPAILSPEPGTAREIPNAGLARSALPLAV